MVHRRTGPLLICGLALTIVCGPATPAAERAGGAQEAIAEQVKKINEAWESDRGAEIMRTVLSDAFMVSLPDPRNPGAWRTLNKEQFCAAFAKMLREHRPKSHVRQTTKVTTKGSVAYENGVSIHVTETGSKRDRILNVWRQEGEAWLLFFSAEITDIEEALR